MKVQLNRYKNITDNLIFISGITRSGKSILCPLISSFKKTENFTLNSVAEVVLAKMHSLLINKEVGKYLIKISYNEILYNIAIGRNLNLKKTDYSSVTNHINFKSYQKRLITHENKLNFKNTLKKNFFPTMFHDLMIDPQTIIEVFPKGKILNIERHPVDVILSWKKKEYGKKYLKNERNLILSFNKNKKIIPFYIIKNYQEFLRQKTDEDRIIFMLWEINKIIKKKYKKLNKKQRKSIITITFDDLTTKTFDTLKRIESFLKIKKSSHTYKIAKKENCPRKPNYTNRLTGNLLIQKKISELNKKKLFNLINLYEKNFFYI
mgnify:CR=1 FL=1